MMGQILDTIRAYFEDRFEDDQNVTMALLETMAFVKEEKAFLNNETWLEVIGDNRAKELLDEATLIEPAAEHPMRSRLRDFTIYLESSVQR